MGKILEKLMATRLA
jgi:hypothetical protein